MKLLIVVMLTFMVACSPKPTKNNVIQEGERLFKQSHIGKNKVVGCIACHSTKLGQVIIGPSLAGLSIRAPYLVVGESAQEYIKNSIINPDVYIVDGFLPAVMFSRYGEELSQEEVHALIQYLSQL